MKENIQDKVIKTRTLKDGTIWRRRVVSGVIITTYERFTGEHILVTKRDKTNVYFEPLKLFSSIYIAIKEGKDGDSGNATLKAKKILDQYLLQLKLNETETVSTASISKAVVALLKPNFFDASLRYGSRYLK